MYMIPVLYKSTEKEFITQGIGALKDAISCTVTEERNGTYELTMKYPITGIHYADIKERNIIAAIPSPYRNQLGVILMACLLFFFLFFYPE